MSDKRRYVIIGTGAIGGTIAGRLAQHGVSVVAVARGAHADAIESEGLLLRTPDGDHRVHPEVWRSPEDARLTADDVLVLAVKSQQAQEALSAWAYLPVAGTDGTAGERLPVLTCLNGVATEDFALRYFRRVYAVCVWAPCVHVEPGVVEAYLAEVSGIFHMGRYPVGLADVDDRVFLGSVQRDWAEAQLGVLLPQDVMAWKYSKLLSNLGNAFNALAGRGEGLDELVERARDEGRAVLEAAGVPVTSEEVEAEARAAGPRFGEIPGASHVGSSSWQSLARGRGDIETDYLNGEIVAIAHRLGMDAPLNSRICVLAQEAARSGRAPGSYTVGELAQALGLTRA
ncbi:MAG TPA: 2-dehydropantoate 2-reductase N-terminal domain-containing protein [Propionibacteriaceae bacterium]|nr:2-dehydropantoate 2-reductase N-terminal domain-containing protein [Propionibacteriaceae bacterium]